MTKREFRGEEGVPEPAYPTQAQLRKYALIGVVGAGVLAAAAAVAHAVAEEPPPPPEPAPAVIRNAHGGNPHTSFGPEPSEESMR
jgi:hypothetical protein